MDSLKGKENQQILACDLAVGHTVERRGKTQKRDGTQLLVDFHQLGLKVVPQTATQFCKNFFAASACGPDEKKPGEPFFVGAVPSQQLDGNLRVEGQIGLFAAAERRFRRGPGGAFPDAGMVGQCRVDLRFGEWVGGSLCTGQKFFKRTKRAGTKSGFNPAIYVDTWSKDCVRCLCVECIKTRNVHGVISSFNPAWYADTIQG